MFFKKDREALRESADQINEDLREAVRVIRAGTAILCLIALAAFVVVASREPAR